LTLAERGGEGAEVVVGAPGFLVLATMNPGGDFGKKELSPALSNRFTQVGLAAGARWALTCSAPRGTARGTGGQGRDGRGSGSAGW
jgi:hypothetical protein